MTQDRQTPSKKMVERLRLILESEWQRSVSTEEAEEVGSGLIRLFDNLAHNSLGYGRLKPHEKVIK